MHTRDSKTFGDLWEERVSLSGSDLFLIYEDADGDETAFTYAAFDEQVRKTATAFDEAGIGHGDRVVVHLPNCPEYLQIWFALLQLGSVVIHSNTFHAEREIGYTIENSDAEYVVTEPTYVDSIDTARAGTAATTVFLTRMEGSESIASSHENLTARVAASEATTPQAAVEPTDDAQIVYTSGTTSDPKGCVHTHANLIASGLRASIHKIVHDETRVLTGLPVFHCNTQSITLATLTTGNELVLLEEFSTKDYPTQLRKHSATKTAIIGTQVRALLTNPPSGTESDNDLEEVLFAINVTDEQKREFEDRFDVTLQNGYGLTEAYTTVLIAPTYGERQWPSIGRPAFDRDVYIVNDEGEPVKDGEMGEIAVGGERGKTLMKEYYRMPEATAKAFTDDGLLLTGDFGKIENGYLYFLDRKKNTIKTRGENVSESEVERVLEKHPAIDEAAIIGVPHEIYGEAIKAYLKSQRETVPVDDVDEYVKEQLATYKVPQEYEVVETFPRTSIGKVEKSALREQVRDMDNA